MSGESSRKRIQEFVSKLDLNKPQGFKSKLYDATGHGELTNLRDNSKVLEDVVKKRATQIKRGEYDQARRKGDYQAMLKGGDLTKEDQGEVKMFLETLGKGPSAKPKPAMPKASTASSGNNRPWKPWEKMPSFLSDKLSPGAKNKPYSPGGSLGLSGNRDSNLSSTQGGANLSPSSSSINPPRLVK